MFCPNCGTEVKGDANYCDHCGEDISDRGDAADAGGSVDAAGTGSAVQTGTTTPAASSAGTASVPAGAAAIDIVCQHCGTRPIEEIAKGHRVNGYILAYTRKHYQLIGCHSCLRRKLWGMGAKNLVTGWWGIKAAVLNFGVTVKNFVRGAINRGPNSNLAEALEDVGVVYDYLEDPADFDAVNQHPMELYVRSFVRLGTAIMVADGRIDADEREVIEAGIREMVPGYPEDQLDYLVDRAAQTPADVERVAEGIGELLGDEGEKLVVAFVASVADAGVTGEEDIELVATIARALDLDEEDVEAVLAGGPEPAMPAAD